jgi:23S rRNA (uridine2552-2'-O)-methyltransferase
MHCLVTKKRYYIPNAPWNATGYRMILPSICLLGVDGDFALCLCEAELGVLFVVRCVMKRGKSRQWMQAHVSDTYVQQSKRDGYRSRAAYKLLALQKKHRFFKASHCIVDLGAAPGGWSQVAQAVVKDVFALDILPMDPLSGVTVVEGDFTQDAVLVALEEKLLGHKVNGVISDIAPNLTGIVATDQAKVMYLVELVIDFAEHHLGAGGYLIIKVFHGRDFEAVLKKVRLLFTKVSVEKPMASRDRSREVYFVCLNKRG